MMPHSTFNFCRAIHVKCWVEGRVGTGDKARVFSHTRLMAIGQINSKNTVWQGQIKLHCSIEKHSSQMATFLCSSKPWNQSWWGYWEEHRYQIWRVHPQSPLPTLQCHPPHSSAPNTLNDTSYTFTGCHLELNEVNELKVPPYIYAEENYFLVWGIVFWHTHNGQTQLQWKTHRVKHPQKHVRLQPSPYFTATWRWLH